MPDRSRAEPPYTSDLEHGVAANVSRSPPDVGGPRCARGCGRRCDGRAPPAPPGTRSRTAASGCGTLSRTACPSAEARLGTLAAWRRGRSRATPQNLASAAARWTRRSGRSRSLTPSTSSPPQWSMRRWVSTTSSRERIVRQVESGQTPEAERRVNRPLFVPGCDLPRLNLVRLLVDTNRAPLSRRLQRR